MAPAAPRASTSALDGADKALLTEAAALAHTSVSSFVVYAFVAAPDAPPKAKPRLGSPG